MAGGRGREQEALSPGGGKLDLRRQAGVDRVKDDRSWQWSPNSRMGCLLLWSVMLGPGEANAGDLLSVGGWGDKPNLFVRKARAAACETYRLAAVITVSG